MENSTRLFVWKQTKKISILSCASVVGRNRHGLFKNMSEKQPYMVTCSCAQHKNKIIPAS